MSASPKPESLIANRQSQIWEWALLVLILILAAGLRLWRLDSIPPGFTHDEAGHGHDAVAILNGARPIYQTVGYGREPLYDYLVAGLMVVFDPTGNVLRFSSVAFGLLTLLATFLWVREAFDGSTALATVALQAVSFWSLAVSRQVLRSGLLPVVFTFAVYFYWRAICRGRGDARQDDSFGARGWLCALRRPYMPRPYALACALFIGATLYTYMPARVVWVVFPVFLVYLALLHPLAFRRAWLPTLLALLIGLLLAVPLFAYLRAHPEAEQRLAMLDEPLQALRTGNVSVMLGRVWSCVTGFFIPGAGDRFLAYNIPGRPIFDPVTGALFLVGVGLCLARCRRPARAFALMWFLVGISPSLITGATAGFTRSIAALPVAYLFPALAIVEGMRWAARRRRRSAAWTILAGFVALVIVTAVISAHDYFVAWGKSPDVRAAYMHPLVEIAGYLDAAPEGASVGISAYLPYAPHDPYVLDMISHRDDLSLRWFDARQAIVLPSEASAVLIAPAGVALDPTFADLPGLRVRERVALREDDLDPYFDVYDWEPQAMAAALQERARGGVADPPMPVDFGGAVQLIGYDLRTQRVAPGGTIELVTLWRVIDPAPLRPRNLSNAEEDWVVFTHALDGAGNVVGQEDRLDAPAWDWQASDVVAQIHRFALQPDLSSGSVVLEIGMYRRSDELRLSVLVDGNAVGKRVLLQHIEVR
ncbi:MAG: glycosyltransferase family 39 protein [Anaerolineae bacterium]|nr:glycosyltransferase family 39 protein [Anaerolineae bacterium]